jgi:hypothetical protein
MLLVTIEAIIEGLEGISRSLPNSNHHGKDGGMT